MYWLSRPPYLRWAAAGALVVGAVVLDLTERATEPYPFLVRPVPAGADIPADAIEHRDVPVGLLPEPGAAGTAAVRDLAEGEPLTAGAAGDGSAIPSGWWSIEVEMRGDVQPGTAVRLISIEPPLDVEGVVKAGAEIGPFSTVGGGLVAVPPDVAGAVARASATGSLTVLIGT